jgi:hypothetical protein
MHLCVILPLKRLLFKGIFGAKLRTKNPPYLRPLGHSSGCCVALVSRYNDVIATF